MFLRVGTLRTFGQWECRVVDRESGEIAYFNIRTREAQKDPPPEVEQILVSESRRQVYDPSPYRFVDVRCCPRSHERSCCQDPRANDWGSCRSSVSRVDLWCGASDSAFLLRNLLSKDECRDIIGQAEGFGLRDTGYSHQIRVNDRVSIMGEDLGELLFERARPFLKDIVIPDEGPPLAVDSAALDRCPACVVQDVVEGVPRGMLKGIWKPTGLNPCFRACKYSPGGFFLAHHDGGFDFGDAHRSIKTFMIYLNDGFEGGPTNFYQETQPHYKPGVPEKVIYSLRPEEGSCLVFNHHIVHDGGQLVAGNKYILRTEVMYKHVSRFRDVPTSDLADISDSDFEPHDDAIPETP